MGLPNLSKMKRSDIVDLVRILWAQILRRKIESIIKMPGLPETATTPVSLFLGIVYLRSAPKNVAPHRTTSQKRENGKKVSALEIVVNPDLVDIRSLPPSVTPVVDPYPGPRTSGIASYNPVAPSTAIPSEYRRTPATADPAGDDPEELWDVRDRYESGLNSHIHIGQDVIQNHLDGIQKG